MLLKKYNLALFIFPILIFSLGIMTLLSISPDRARSQVLYFVVGLVFYFAISTVDYVIYKHYWKAIYGFVLGLLALTFTLGTVVSGSARWLSFGSFNLQPSEFAKIAVIVSLAAIIATSKKIFSTPLGLAKLLALIIPISVLVLVQPDLGTTLAIIGIFAVILFFAGLNKLYFLLGFIFMGIFSTPTWKFLQDYQRERILVFLNPTLDVLGSGYNVIQSVIAVGSGGLFGRGFGRGTQSHLQFLPAYWTDFIFASFAEEWGFIGVVGLIILYLGLLVTLIYVAVNVKDTFASLLTVGAFTLFFLQFTINIGMNLGIMPVTGIPLPLVSYGGSSMITSLILLGLVQSVWVYRKRY